MPSVGEAHVVAMVMRVLLAAPTQTAVEDDDTLRPIVESFVSTQFRLFRLYRVREALFDLSPDPDPILDRAIEDAELQDERDVALLADRLRQLLPRKG